MARFLTVGGLMCALSGLAACATQRDIAEAGNEAKAYDEELDGSSQALSVDNGLSAWNGLTTTNGLAAYNGLRTLNGMPFVSGLNDLNGLLSQRTGLLRWIDDVTTARNFEIAQYVVRCALPSGDSLVMQRKTSSTTSAKGTFSGQLGIAPTWKTGSCDATCQERISACLMALTNMNGQHRSIQISAAWGNIGVAHGTYNTMEAVFFGNLFLNPPQAYVASGYDHSITLHLAETGYYTSSDIENLMTRSCNALWGGSMSQFTRSIGNCPYKHVGSVNKGPETWSGWASTSTKCEIIADSSTKPTKGTARKCSGPGTTNRTWMNPLTSWRSMNTWLY